MGSVFSRSVRAFYGPKLVGSPSLKVEYATQNVVRARATCCTIRVSVLTRPVNLPGASRRGSQVLWFLWALHGHRTGPLLPSTTDHMMFRSTYGIRTGRYYTRGVILRNPYGRNTVLHYSAATKQI